MIKSLRYVLLLFWAALQACVFLTSHSFIWYLLHSILALHCQIHAFNVTIFQNESLSPSTPRFYGVWGSWGSRVPHSFTCQQCSQRIWSSSYEKLQLSSKYLPSHILVRVRPRRASRRYVPASATAHLLITDMDKSLSINHSSQPWSQWLSSLAWS